MDILAENRFNITKALFVEARLAMSGEDYRKATRKLVALLAAVAVVLVAVSLLLGMAVPSVIMECIIIGFMAFWLLYLFPRSSAKTAYRTLERKCGKEPERVTRFYEDHLEIEGPGVNTELFYEQIVRVLETKHLLILVTDEKGGVMLRPDCFTIGGEAEVRRLAETGKTE